MSKNCRGSIDGFLVHARADREGVTEVDSWVAIESIGRKMTLSSGRRRGQLYVSTSCESGRKIVQWLCTTSDGPQNPLTAVAALRMGSSNEDDTQRRQEALIGRWIESRRTGSTTLISLSRATQHPLSVQIGRPVRHDGLCKHGLDFRLTRAAAGQRHSTFWLASPPLTYIACRHDC